MGISVNFHETPMGFWGSTDSYGFFFGKKPAQLQGLKTEFPRFQFSRIRQTHSDLISEASHGTPEDLSFEALPEADAQISSCSGLALLIATADCTPVLIVDRRLRITASIHAGWRGVEQRIVPKTLTKMIQRGSKVADLTLAMGPHIGPASFEVENSVRDRLLQSTSSKPSSALFQDLGSQKSLVDLRSLVHLQMDEFEISKSQRFDLNHDTKTDLRFHSHRRDREQAGRQLSFSVLF